jgi:hypothetical protein
MSFWKMQLVVEDCCNSLIGWIKVSVITAFWSAYILQKSFQALSFESVIAITISQNQQTPVLAV